MRKGILVGLAVAAPILVFAGSNGEVGPDPEVVRIREHLTRVSHILRTNQPLGLSAEQLVARHAALEWLDEYRDVGVFPHNHVRPGERVPVFVDPHGTPCAVGYLMVRSGAYGKVEEIVRTNNLVRVPELEDDAQVASWLEAHGLTLAEAALIQPSYDYDPPASSGAYGATTVGFAVATAALASYSAMAGLDAGSPWMDLLTVGTASGHAVLLLESSNDSGEEAGWAVGLNVIGLFVGLGTEVLRLTGREAEEAQGSEPPLQAYVIPGRSGTEIGFSLRH